MPKRKLEDSSPENIDVDTFLASLLDDEEKRRTLELAVDAGFLLQEVEGLKAIAASSLASLPRDQPLPALDLVKTAQSHFSKMRAFLMKALEAGSKNQASTTDEELKEFVQLAASLSEAAVKVWDLTRSSEGPNTPLQRELPSNLLSELRSFAEIETRVPSKAAKFVIQQLKSEKSTSSGNVICVEVIVALLKQCADIVRLLEDDVSRISSLLDIVQVPKSGGPTLKSSSRPLPKSSGSASMKRVATAGDAPTSQATVLNSSKKERELPYYKQKVFFATDREPEDSKEGKLAYSSKMRDTLETGWTNISIPKKWEDGSLRRPGEAGSDTDDTSEKAATYHIILLPGENQRFSANQRSEFYSLLGQDVTSHNQELLLFIHGYNNSFKEAIRTAGQLAFDLKNDERGPYGGAVLAYDWASLDSLLRYGFLPGVDDDRDRAQRTAGRLATLLEDLAVKLPGIKLHIVAHSMGNYVLKNALHEMLKRTGERGKVAAIRAMTRTVTFAAPDVDRDDFMKMIALIVQKAGQQPVATLLCSLGDLALLVSSVLRGFEFRAGFYRALPGVSRHKMHPVFVKDGLDTIDASGFAKDTVGHGYFSDSKSLLSEISKIINTCVGAEERMKQLPSSIERQTGVCGSCLKWYKIKALEDATLSG